MAFSRTFRFFFCLVAPVGFLSVRFFLSATRYRASCWPSSLRKSQLERKVTFHGGGALKDLFFFFFSGRFPPPSFLAIDNRATESFLC